MKVHTSKSCIFRYRYLKFKFQVILACGHLHPLPRWLRPEKLSRKHWIFIILLVTIKFTTLEIPCNVVSLWNVNCPGFHGVSEDLQVKSPRRDNAKSCNLKEILGKGIGNWLDRKFSEYRWRNTWGKRPKLGHPYLAWRGWSSTRPLKPLHKIYVLEKPFFGLCKADYIRTLEPKSLSGKKVIKNEFSNYRIGIFSWGPNRHHRCDQHFRLKRYYPLLSSP